MKYILLAALFTFSSCSNIQMRYRAKITNSAGDKGAFVYDRSYRAGPTHTWCWITGIFYGGACWNYALMPSSGQAETIRRDAEEKLKSLMEGHEFNIDRYRIIKLSWARRRTSAELDIEQSTPIQKEKKQSAPAIDENLNQDLDGFIR
jgi:hypothetical protein